MALRTLTLRSSLRAIRPEIGFSLSRFKAEPLAAKQVPVFEALRAGWTDIHEKELTLYDQLIEAKAVAVTLDRGLNVLASRLSKSLMIITEDDATHDLYKHYFRKKSVREFCRPILGSQLAAMIDWIPSLMKSDHEPLKALGAEVEAATKVAEVAAKKKRSIELEIKAFRETGERKKFIDACNAARKLAYGELSKMAHESDSLPASFADSFFLHETANDEEVTVESVEETIEGLTAELEEQQALLVQLKAQEEARAKAEAEALAQRAAIAELEKIKKDAEKKAAALRAKLRK